MTEQQEQRCKREMNWRPGDGPIKTPDCLRVPVGAHQFTRQGRCRWCGADSEGTS
jgi:hypothetical protein